MRARWTVIGPRLVIGVGLGLALVIGGCAYFNLFYNARDAFDEGERIGEDIDPRDQPTNPQRAQYNRAIRKCLLLLDEYPDSGLVDDALFLMGKSHYRMREWSEAIRNFENLLVNFPASEFAEESTYLLSISYLSRGDEDEGMQWFARLREGYPDGIFSAEALYRLGDAWANAGRLSRAAESYEEFIEIYPDRPEVARTRVALARIYLKDQQPESALAALEEFRTDNVESPKQSRKLRYEAETLRVDALIRLGRFEEALAAVGSVEAAADTDAQRRRGVLLRGRALLRLGRVDEGRKVLADLVAAEGLQPEATTARRISIEYFSRHEGPDSERLREELKSAEDAGRMAGTDVSVVRGHVALLKTYDSLRASYESGDSTAASAAFRLGEMVFTRYQRPAEAFKWYAISLGLDANGPLAPRALYAMGWLSTERLGDPEAGEGWFAKLEECCPESPQARALRGEEFVDAKPRTLEELQYLAGLGPNTAGDSGGPVNLDDPRRLPWRSLRRGGPGALSPRESGS